MIDILFLLLLPLSTEVATAQDANCACFNGGIFNGNRCICPSGYVGLYCEQKVNTTEVYIPCDGTCKNGHCDYTCGTCVCHPFYTGEQCDRPLIVPCGDYYCFNEGTCAEDGSGKEFCQCTQGYGGEYCLYPNETCYCLNGGACDTATGNTTCTCPAGFTGQHCETEICTPGCPANAYCCNGTCQCYPGYTGDNCTEVDGEVLPWTKCGDYFCFNGGTCQNDTCQCGEGFGGDYCLYSDCANSTDNQALETCGAHVCYYGGTCVNDTCQCPNNTFGVYCEYVKAPTKSPTITLEEYVTYATLRWNLPSGYEAIASSGGVWYTITVENMATGQKRTITAVNTTRSYDMTQSTEYCFTVRAEVSGGSGEYSEKKCITTQEHGSCFCVNGEYRPEREGCICQSGFYGTYCAEHTEPAHCPAEAEYNLALGHIFNWTETTAGQEAQVPCPCRSMLDITRDIYATRACLKGGTWGDTDDKECSVATVRELCEAESVCDLLTKVQAVIQGGNMQPAGITAILTAVELLAKGSCSAQTGTSSELLGALDNTLSTSDNVLKMIREKTNAATTLVSTLEEIATRALDKEGTGGSWKVTRENFAVSSSAVVKDTMTENGFSISFDGSVRARLSSNLFNDRSCNSSVVISSAINANKAELFGGAVEGEVDVRQIVSSILSVTVGNCTVSGSTEAIEMTFTVPQSAEHSTLGCYYWKPSAQSGLGAWSTTGCAKLAEVQRGEVACSCSHLTTFAVLQGTAANVTLVHYYYYVAGAVAAALLLLLIVAIVVAVCCCGRRRKYSAAHGFIQETDLPIIPGTEDLQVEGYCALNMSTMNSSSHGNHYDTVIPNPEAVNTIYDEIPANATDGADMSKEKSSLAAMESCPHNIYDSADGATAVPSDKGEVATEHYECMQAPAAAYSNTGM